MQLAQTYVLPFFIAWSYSPVDEWNGNQLQVDSLSLWPFRVLGKISVYCSVSDVGRRPTHCVDYTNITLTESIFMIDSPILLRSMDSSCLFLIGNLIYMDFQCDQIHLQAELLV